MSSHPGKPEPQGGGYRGIYSLFVNRPVLTLMVVSTILLVGSISMARLPLRFLPDGLDQNEIRVQIPIRLSRSPEEVREVVAHHQRGGGRHSEYRVEYCQGHPRRRLGAARQGPRNSPHGRPGD